MAIIFVMTKQQKHSYAEVLDGLLNQQAYFLYYIKSTDFEEDDLTGLKLFLESNNYDVDALKNFVTPRPLVIKVKKGNAINYLLKMAAMLILLITVGYFIKISNSKNSGLETYMIEDAGFKVWMSTNSSNVDLLNGMNYYRNKNYDEALSYFSKLPKSDTAIYYSGISLMKLNKLNEAEVFLINVSDESVYKNTSMYYLALCYIFNNKQKQGIQIFSTNDFDNKEMECNRKLILKDYLVK
jgi:hypothetical protein